MKRLLPLHIVTKLIIGLSLILTFNKTTAQMGCPSALAYSGASTTGNQSWTGPLGMDFDVVQPGGISITGLGAFDDMGNGINGIIEVAIFDRSTGNIVPGLYTTITGSGDLLLQSHRIVNMAPVLLPVGEYSVVAKGYSSIELNGNSGYTSGFPASVTNSGSGAIQFTGTARYSGGVLLLILL